MERTSPWNYIADLDCGNGKLEFSQPSMWAGDDEDDDVVNADIDVAGKDSIYGIFEMWMGVS